MSTFSVISVFTCAEFILHMFFFVVFCILVECSVLFHVFVGRYFTKQELHELFVLDDPTTSQTQIQLNQLHSGLRKPDVSLHAHIAFLHTLGTFRLCSDDHV